MANDLYLRLSLNRFAVDRSKFTGDNIAAVRISRGVQTRVSLFLLNELVQMG